MNKKMKSIMFRDGLIEGIKSAGGTEIGSFFEVGKVHVAVTMLPESTGPCTALITMGDNKMDWMLVRSDRDLGRAVKLVQTISVIKKNRSKSKSAISRPRLRT